MSVRHFLDIDGAATLPTEQVLVAEYGQGLLSAVGLTEADQGLHQP